MTFGNVNKLLVSHIGYAMVTSNIKLKDVLVVPSIGKNVVPISKLTIDNPLYVLFPQP